MMSNQKNKGQTTERTNSEDKHVNKPTIGDAIEEAIESEEVIMQREKNIGGLRRVQDNNIEGNDTKGEKIDISLSSSNDNEDLSNLTIENISENTNEILFGKEKIVIDQETLENREEESTIKTVTSIPTEEGKEIEVQTEIQVPVDDENKEIESESKIKVRSDVDDSKEIPVT